MHSPPTNSLLDCTPEAAPDSLSSSLESSGPAAPSANSDTSLDSLLPSMARRRKHHGVKWTLELTANLLACLDFVVLRGVNRKHFGGLAEPQIAKEIDSILGDIQDKLIPRLEKTQIRGKLWRMYSQGGDKYARHNFPEVFQHGSIRIVELDEETRYLANWRYKEIADESYTRTNTLRHPQVRIEVSRSRSLRTQTPTARASRRATTATSLRASTSRTATPCKSPLNPKRTSPPVEKAEPPTKRYKRNVKVAEAGSSSKPPQPPTLPKVLLVDSATQTDPFPKLGNPQSGRKTHEIGAQKVDTLLDGSKDDGPVCAREPATPAREDILGELWYRDEELLLAQKKTEDLERECRQLRALIVQSKAISPNWQKEIERKSSKIFNLEARIRNQEFLRPYLTGKGRDLDVKRFYSLQTKFEDMRSRFGSISNIAGLQYLHTAIPSGEPDVLEGLVRKLDTNSSPTQRFTPTERGETIPSSYTIQFLTGEAVQQWVFLERYTNAMMMGSPLLEEYRKYIESIADADFLTNLDFAAHQSLADRQHSQGIHPSRTASSLAERLLLVLRPLLVHQPGIEATTLLRPKLEGIFRTALEIKILVMISKDLYECVWPAKDARFDQQSMETERSRYSEGEQTDVAERESKVRLVLFPGLRVFPHKRKLVDYYGFRKDSGQVSGQPLPIVKAKVLL